MITAVARYWFEGIVENFDGKFLSGTVKKLNGEPTTEEWMEIDTSRGGLKVIGGENLLPGAIFTWYLDSRVITARKVEPLTEEDIREAKERAERWYNMFHGRDRGVPSKNSGETP